MHIFIYYLLGIFCTHNLAHGIAFDGLHIQDDYINISYTSPEFDAACAVVDKRKGVSLTGVLVKNRVVMTAAHAFDAIFNKSIIAQFQQNNIGIVPVNSMYVEFKMRDSHGDEYVQKIKVVAVIVDVRYFDGEFLRDRKGTFDFAYLVLDGTPDGIKPIQFLNEHILSNDALLTVVSYGTSDALIYNPLLLRRAFRLYERDTYYGNGKDPEILNSVQHVQESSLFFKPNTNDSEPSKTGDEDVVRNMNATYNWLLDGKKPYGLALPGTSGSPVFVHLNDGIYLLALISSFAHISGIFKHSDMQSEIMNIILSPSSVLGEYQTIYSLPYTRTEDGVSKSNCRRYMRDNVVSQFIQLAEDTALKFPAKKYTKRKKIRFWENPWLWFKNKMIDEYLS